MTTALYRRYRPESFAEVIGQEQVTGPLSIALTKNRVNHAYLFSGPRGCGKTTSARILARCLNCEQGPTPTPCGTCPSCVDLARGGPGSLDVVEIDAASHGGVDDARDLRERAAFAPVRDRYKVFIIDEAHMVSPQGFNALLKIVEEPPEHIRFIFATTEPEKVIGTIRSRTHHYPFRLVPPERLVQYLDELCEREAVPAGKGVLPLVVRAGGGSVRDTLSVLDQLMGGAGEDGLTYATAIGLLGYTDATLLDDVVDALAAGDGATVFRVIDRVIESGHDPRRFVEDLLERLRDLLVVAAVKDGGHAVFRGMPDDQLERMRSQAGRFGAAELSRSADVTNAALTEMTGATSPRLQLELLCARLLLPSADDEQRGLGARLDRLEKRIGSGALPVAAGAPAQQATSAPAVDAAPSDPVAMSSGLAAVRAAIGSSGRPGTGAPAESSAAPARPQTGTPAVQPSQQAPATEPAVQPAAPEQQPTAQQQPQASPPQPAVQQPVVQQSVSPGPGSADLEAVRRNWSDVLNAVASIKRTTWSLVSQYAQVLDYDGKRLLLGFDSTGRAQLFGRGPHANFMRQALIQVIGLDCVVEAAVSSEFQAGSSGTRPAASPPPPASPAPASPPGSGAPTAGPSGAGPAASGPTTSARSAPSTEPAPHSAPQPRAAWAERPAAPGAGTPGPAASAWSEVPQNPNQVPQNPNQVPQNPQQVPQNAQPAGAVGVVTREAPPAPASPVTAPAPVPPRSIGAAAARAAAAAATARQQNQGQSRRPAGSPQDDERGMPTPEASPYDDIPVDLNEPVREDEAPPDGGGRPTPRRTQPQPQQPGHVVDVTSAPSPAVVDLADDPVGQAGRDFDSSPLMGVQAVEQLLGGRVIEERDL
ncbi:DNA polymerase III subunit gamma and tau [Kineosporia sp. J2-2]|uniref:DNA-directed DNA polymerase n=1 Tax=Kineosporia corallincola TaxID=2835133 RepID=A0ABS5T8E3_9ACTN|nr:DNA polymerase III subunit gamma and tau [Kineosporia corallincola]MBT0767312.1 DNA polymerase III subunit gamma and tau [Kineosporia corallincola]